MRLNKGTLIPVVSGIMVLGLLACLFHWWQARSDEWREFNGWAMVPQIGGQQKP